MPPSAHVARRTVLSRFHECHPTDAPRWLPTSIFTAQSLTSRPVTDKMYYDHARADLVHHAFRFCPFGRLHRDRYGVLFQIEATQRLLRVTETAGMWLHWQLNMRSSFDFVNSCERLLKAPRRTRRPVSNWIIGPDRMEGRHNGISVADIMVQIGRKHLTDAAFLPPQIWIAPS